MPSGLNIRAVAERTGIPLHTLRAWERRYGVPRPARVPGNKYRVYDEQDVADVLWIKRQVESGVSPARASALLQQHERSMPVSVGAPLQPLAVRRQGLSDSLLAYDEQSAQQILDEAFALYSHEQVALQVIQPAMAGIGAGWHDNRLTIGQEHFATNLVRQRLLTLLQAQPVLPQTAPAVIAACAPAEQHELGLLLFALLARRSGMRVLYLGPRTPLVDLVRETGRARLVALSVSTVHGLASLIPLWREGKDLPAGLLFGGNLPNQVPPLREHLPGTFLGTDAVEAVRTLTTREGASPRWRPSAEALSAANALQEGRLKFTELFLGRESGSSPTGVTEQDSYLDATLLLLDALSGSLAFGVAELVDEQVRWIRHQYIARGREPAVLDGQLKRFASLCRRVTHEHAQEIEPLLERIRAAAGEGK